MLARLRRLGENVKRRLTVHPDTRAGSVRALEVAAWGLFALVPLAILVTAFELPANLTFIPKPMTSSSPQRTLSVRRDGSTSSTEQLARALP